MEKPFKIAISNGLMAPAIQVQSLEDLPAAMRELALHSPCPILVIVGGASRMSEADLARLRALFVKVLAPLAEELGASVVDGGTDAGVMQMMGQARAETAATFPLIGVTPVGKVALPDRISASKVTALEPNHTHFVLVPGSNWGDESPWLAHIASVLANGAPSVTVLVNGGEIAWKDVSENLKANRPLLAIAGSGRLADTLAGELRGEATDERARELVASGLVRAIDLTESFDSLTRSLNEMFFVRG
ncbi:MULTISPECIES: hypothetical protein [Trichocoleus]|uniref:LSDAT prokaryote domain-containing protein n=1 Tax=Trichocoleus desertorum GB2-A4 TaxID=2933944 RepID=A0ABV0JGR3_9CYAN|nr:hypothetical protein [Trichocoleus sp. FACHB-46]MBD1860075.1 hypothetical protein [Trichocoleus sp. FACHB-46]